MMRSPRPQPDEGFSEETRSQPDSEMLYLESVDDDLLNRILQQPPDKLKSLAEHIIWRLPNPDKEDIGRLCERLTHFDPLAYLPHELTLHILSYLAPRDLLSCAATSKPWRERSRDEKLWRGCFAREGWVVDTTKMASYEAKRAAGLDAEKKGSRKRGPNEAFDEEASRTPSRIGTSVQGHTSDGDKMEGVEISSTSPVTHRDISMDISRPNTGISPASGLDVNVKLAPPMFRPNTKDFKLSWPYLYKQRCRLERNWEEGKCVPFQLPRADRPQDGHTECVYAIQHTSKHLVSGSRDKSIRIWDLDKYELKRKPLWGHEASVLCLQFDERPEHDIIVSGGSDAYVIVWRFSTGEIIKKMTQAHTESVLNLRFDDRYIVTCSKDKTIKIWNRQALDLSDDLVPTHALQTGDLTMDGDLIKEYSLLSTLTGHGAAVNAVIIHGNLVVSASGDRTLKAWDIKTGTMSRNYQGHTKGIACVQFDGRRIVSGSSDNSVRIFDAEKQAEVACLQAHGNLVRTVQARFGDLNTVTDEELEDEAKQADDAFFKALENGMQPATASRNGQRNAGSRRPQDMLTLGTKVPPGGGGNRWSRIVSGSYDESIIVWKRDRDGKWIDKYRLMQAHHLNQRGSRRQLAVNMAAFNTNAATLLPPAAHQYAARGAAEAMTQTQIFTATADQSGNVQLQLTSPFNQASSSSGTAQQTQAPQNSPHAVQAPHQGPNNQTHQHGQVPAHAQLGANVAAPLQQQQPTQPPGAAANNANHAPQGQAPALNHVHPPRPESNRVFKLQFDTRRIISCSQNRVIVGWDFANGDKDLENIGTWSVETA